MEGATLDALTREFSGLTGDLIERRVAAAIGPGLPAAGPAAAAAGPRHRARPRGPRGPGLARPGGRGRGRRLGLPPHPGGARHRGAHRRAASRHPSQRRHRGHRRGVPTGARRRSSSPDLSHPPEGPPMATIVLLVVIAVIVLWVIGAYNGLIALKNQVANAWKQIDVQLKRRHDLIPNLVNTVKGAMEFERGTLEAVIAARNKAVSATGVKRDRPGRGRADPGAGPAVRADRGLSRPQGEPERAAAPGGAHQHREQGRLRAPALQRRRRRSTTPSRPPSRPCSWPDWPRPSPPSCGRSRTPPSGRCRRSISRSTNRRSERGRQPLRTAGSQPPPLDLAGRRLHPLLRLGGIRRRPRLRAR